MEDKFIFCPLESQKEILSPHFRKQKENVPLYIGVSVFFILKGEK